MSQCFMVSVCRAVSDCSGTGHRRHVLAEDAGIAIRHASMERQMYTVRGAPAHSVWDGRAANHVLVTHRYGMLLWGYSFVELQW